MEFKDIFLKEKDTYVRRLDPIGQYVEQATKYLQQRTGCEQSEARQHVLSQLKENAAGTLRDPLVSYYLRGDNGDEEVDHLPLSKYIKAVVEENEILAPSFTAYLHPSVKESILVRYTDRNVKLRSIAKKEKFKAKQQKDFVRMVFKDNEQNNRKIKNNSLSGLFVAKGSVLCNPTAHSTLTSITRTGTSLVNASNERMVAGSRHYWSPEIVINNLAVAMTYCNEDQINAAIKEFGLVYPTHDDTMRCIQWSTDLYWKDRRRMEEIEKVVFSMTDVQRAAFVYSGDLYHLRELNPQVIKNFIFEMAEKVEGHLENPLEVMKTLDSSIIILAHQICKSEVEGKGTDYELMEKEGILPTLILTACHVMDTLVKYRNLIQAFFTTLMLPPSVAYVPTMIRRSAVLSDTDSSCYSVDEWIVWSRGKMIFDDRTFALGGVVGFMAAQVVTHLLAVFSANINVAKDRLHTLAYKGEWVWSVMDPMNVAKHYFARAVIQEGNVFEDPELELKGVHLKSSSIPKFISHDVVEWINHIQDVVTSNKLLSMRELLTHVINIELKIKDSLLKGELDFYRLSKIKEAEAYSKSETESPYLHHLLWEEVFEPKYGRIEPPVYMVIKVPTTMENPTDVVTWLKGLEDQDFANRMADWMTKMGKRNIATFYISTNYLSANGMPKELVSIIDVRRIILDLTNVYRIILESLGFYAKPGLLVSEFVRLIPQQNEKTA